MTSAAARRFLIVEDEIFVAIMLEQMLSELGHEVVRMAHTAEAATGFIYSHPGAIDAATLDINLGGSHSHEVADALVAHGVPFIIATGYEGCHFPEYQSRPFVDKPLVIDQLRRAVQTLDPRRPEPG